MEIDVFCKSKDNAFYCNNLENVLSDDEFKKFKIKTKNDSRSRTFTKKRKKRSMSNVPNNNNLIDVSEKLTNNVRSVRHILSKNDDLQPSYLSQFDAQTFDSIGLPSAPNDTYSSSDKFRLADLERKISYDNNWSKFNDGCNDMSYGVVPNDKLVHQNMTPSFKDKNGYGSNDLRHSHVVDFKNDLFTGNMKNTWIEKENNPLFSPMANLAHIYGTPVRTGEEMNRFIPSMYKQNESCIEQIKVTPGVNIGSNGMATHGYHSMYRDIGKNIDDLHVKPRNIFEGRIIEGQRGQARPQQPPVIKYKPDTFKTATDDDLLPNHSDIKGPKTRDNFMMKETDRINQHIEYTGGAHVSQDAVQYNVPEYMRPKIKSSTRQNYTLPAPLQKFSKSEAIHNPNYESFYLPALLKEQVIQNNHIGLTDMSSATYTNIDDPTKMTLREIISSTSTIDTRITPNTMRGTTYSLDMTDPTLKEITCINRLNPHAASLNDGPRTYSSDVPKTTNRETISEPIVAFVGQNINLYTNITEPIRTTGQETLIDNSIYPTITPINQGQMSAHPRDAARITNRETLLDVPNQTTIVPVNQYQMAPHPQDVMKTTNRETLLGVPNPTTIVPVNQYQMAPHPQDVMRTTNQETLVNNPYQSMITPVNQHQRAPNPQDVAKTTNRETMVALPYSTMITPINQHQNAPHPQDVVKTTNRETLVNIPYQTMISPVNQQQRAPYPQDVMKTTNRETIVAVPYSTMITPVDQHQRAPHPQDITKTTNRETLVNIPYPTTITPVNHYQRAQYPQDPMRTTNRETIVTIPYSTMITPVDQHQRAPHPQDIARTTNRETIVAIPYQTTITPVDQHQRAPHPQDITRTTNRETIVTIPYQTNVTPVDQFQRAPDPQDVMRTTNRETIVAIPYNTHITSTDQQQGYATTFNRAPLRTTNREGLLEIPYNTYASCVDQQQGCSTTFNRAPLKSTNRESIVTIPYNTYTVAVGQSQRAPLPQDTLRTTMKESMLETPNYTHTLAVGQFQRAGDPMNCTRTTLKEQLVEIPYNTHTSFIDQQQGCTTTFNRTPLKMTTKESTINNEYLAPINGENKHKIYDDAYNATIDDKKISVLQYRPPTNCGVTVGPDAAAVNFRLKSIDDTLFSRNPVPEYTFNNNLDRLRQISTIKNNGASEMFIDPIILKQLETNPFCI